MSFKDTTAIYVQSLKAPDFTILADEVLSNKRRAKGSVWTVDESITPADLYIYFHARFGSPNGTMMVARAPHSNNLIHWHYTLKSGSTYLDVIGLSTRTELWISDYTNLTDEDWRALIAAIKNDFGSYGKELTAVRAKLEKWRLFYNPYRRLETIVEKLSQELSQIDASTLVLPPDPTATPGLMLKDSLSKTDDLHEFTRKIAEAAKNYALARERSICLRLLCPVWGESFVNFVIFFLARDEIKNDDRLYQEYIRNDIDIRIKLLHINCKHFDKPIDTSQRAYKDFHSLMNDRNDILHGNVDPSKLGYETVYFDGTIPLFTESQGLAINSLGKSLIGIEPSETLTRVKIVRSFIEFILGHIEPSVRGQLILLLKQRDIGWRSDIKGLGILFDNVIGGFAR